MSISNKARHQLQDQVDGKTVIPIAQLIGFKLISFDYGRSKFTMKVTQKHHNPMGTVHGGIYCDIADAAMGVAFATTLAENETFGTVNFQINFLKTAREEEFVAEGYLLKKTRTIGFLEAKIYDSLNDLVATAQSTCKIINLKS